MFSDLTVPFRRYFKYELLAKKAITKESLPIFLSSWLDRSNAVCMFSAAQQRTWSSSHLASGAWYLDCATSYTPSFEEELKKSREETEESEDAMEDLNAIDDEAARSKALQKRLESDRRKSQKLKEAQEKAELKEQERLVKLNEKSSKKAKRKATPLETEGNVSLNKSPTVDSATQGHSMQTRSARKASSYEDVFLPPVMDTTHGDDIFNDEFILNSSLDEVLGGESGELPQSYTDLKAFISSVSTLLQYCLSAFDIRYCLTSLILFFILPSFTIDISLSSSGVQHIQDRVRHYKGESNIQPCVDLIFVDMPEGLPVPGFSNLPTFVPPWNQVSKDYLQPVFDFADQHLQDDGAIIIIHPFRLSTKSSILGYCKTYGFEVRKEWWGMNRLHLTSPSNPASTVSITAFSLHFLIMITLLG